MQETDSRLNTGAGSLIDDRYVVLEVLRADPQRAKYLVRDKQQDKNKSMIIKTVPQDLLDQLAGAPQALKELKQGSELDHPNIGPRYWFNLSESIGHYFLFEKLEGVSLAKLLAAGKGFLLEEICHFLHETAKGLAHGHEQGLIHRNIHPAAVFVSTDGSVKLSYFGMAGLPRLQAGQALGKIPVQAASYFAPEELSSGEITPQVDIYCLGILAYQLFFGELPFVGDTVEQTCERILAEPVPSLAQIGPEVPENLVRFVETATAKDPAERYESMEKVVQELSSSAPGKIELNVPVSERPATPNKQAPTGFKGTNTLTRTEERPLASRVLNGVFWFIPFFLATSILTVILLTMITSWQMVLQYGIGFFQSHNAQYVMSDSLKNFTFTWGPVVLLGQIILTALLSITGDLPGTGPVIEIRTALARRLEPRKPIPMSKVPAYIYFVCGWPIMLLFLGGALGGFLGAIAAGSSIDVYRRSRSIGLGFLCSVFLGIVAFIGWAVIASALAGSARQG